MFSQDAVTVRVYPSPRYAALLLVAHCAGAVAPALAGAPGWVALPLGATVFLLGVRAAWRRALQRGPDGVDHVQIRSDGHIRLSMRDGRELDARQGPGTWVTTGFVMLDLRERPPEAPRAVLLGGHDPSGLRRVTVLLRWGRSDMQRVAATGGRERRSG